MTLPNNIILSNAIKSLTDVDFIINGMPETEKEISENVKWIVGEDSIERAIYGDNSAVTWAQIKTKYDELKAIEEAK
jgi:coenzyme F420-reducing hydrogenase gamma subunit